ncbi:CRISPR-associated endonuclease Cas2 [Candidatus Giovannonibacteria bacterium RIFCSPHIGHO2_01_FULL_45_33]|uniref:CRISPR-associated endonuclease Cas2 n=1 Tax=Candidatus Giovannonibacteria bacterium RIFCSPLOWO2_01_FULL_45_34 TaxID=1798351 RepID=A0A1F5X1D4_9BACT|nr:MAG: CRISPR-associated endonuclease Cas2 [Candidatus Giovannonibacteria bacterium RIFCSPHIGHO2_01_FULL_45_33]OGF81709.1 MAG: CRISPR-associated endonuclease Cas2 [Candidatus Giovannonibacteria bacterium RIFCSPLOWO2_01_FULL_45_34]
MLKIRKARYKRKRIYSPWKKKLLLLFLGGIAVGAMGSKRGISRFFTSIPKEFRKINKEYLRQLITEFYRDRLVDMVDVSDGQTRIVLTEKGKLRAMEFSIDDLKIKLPPRWDKKWRVVMFDIPEKNRQARDALRSKLRELGFYELQKSVFVFPYECKDEIDFVIEVFDIRRHVRYGILESVTNEANLLKYFDLL